MKTYLTYPQLLLLLLPLIPWWFNKLIFPDVKIKAVVFGSQIHMITANLGIILSIPGMENYRLKVKPAVKIHHGNNILESGNNAPNSHNVLLFKSKGNRH